MPKHAVACKNIQRALILVVSYCLERQIHGMEDSRFAGFIPAYIEVSYAHELATTVPGLGC